MVFYIIFIILILTISGCDKQKKSVKKAKIFSTKTSAGKTLKSNPRTPAIVTAARKQIGKTTIYDPAYVSLQYPGGDIPIERGVCTDVIIRALRDAKNIDLQKLIHEDMKKNFSKYPKIWGLKKPDKNIDHRRVPNIQKYFKGKGFSIKITNKPNDYLPGDFVTCSVGRNLPHIMIVSDKKTQSGIPLVIHNIGNGTQENNSLFSFPITGHYRLRDIP